MRLAIGGGILLLALVAQPQLPAYSNSNSPPEKKEEKTKNIREVPSKSGEDIAIPAKVKDFYSKWKLWKPFTSSKTQGTKPVLSETNSPLVAGIKKRSNSQFLLLDERNVLLNVPFVHQYDDLPDNKKDEIMKSACGPAALTMSFKYFGVETTLMQVIDKLPTNVYIRGAMFYNLPAGSEIYNFKSTTIEPAAKAIYTALKEGYPVILNVQNYNGIIGHALLITGIRDFDGEKARALIVHDPYVDPNREFTFESSKTLRQPEGYINYIGTLKPFYISPARTAP